MRFQNRSGAAFRPGGGPGAENFFRRRAFRWSCCGRMAADDGVVGRAFGHARAFDRIHECDAVLPPMLAFLHKMSSASKLVSPTETTGSPAAFSNVTEMSSLDLTSSLVRALTSKLSTGSRRSWNNRAAKAQRPDNRAQGVGDFLGAVPQVGLGRLADADMLLDLPRDDQHPDPQQQCINQVCCFAWVASDVLVMRRLAENQFQSVNFSSPAGDPENDPVPAPESNW